MLAERILNRPKTWPLATFTLRSTRMSHTDAMVVMTTVASADEAVTLIKTLLERRLIACGQIVPGVRSLYRWNGKIADESEVIVYLKTRAARLDSLEVAFAELHPYKVPELLALPVTAGLSKYLSWINAETSLALA
jgi:periplasmic divalent cation tolerance protein